MTSSGPSHNTVRGFAKICRDAGTEKWNHVGSPPHVREPPPDDRAPVRLCPHGDDAGRGIPSPQPLVLARRGGGRGARWRGRIHHVHRLRRRGMWRRVDARCLTGGATEAGWVEGDGDRPDPPSPERPQSTGTELQMNSLAPAARAIRFFCSSRISLQRTAVGGPRAAHCHFEGGAHWFCAGAGSSAPTEESTHPCSWLASCRELAWPVRRTRARARRKTRGAGIQHAG